MKASAHPPLSVLEEGLTGRELPAQFSKRHRDIYDLILTWQVHTRLDEAYGTIDIYRAEIVDSNGVLWPIVFRTGPELPETLERNLPPRISAPALAALRTLDAGLAAEDTDSSRWTTPVAVELLGIEVEPYCGAVLPHGDEAGPEWLPLSGLLTRCAADDAIGAHNVAAALGRLHEGGFIEIKQEKARSCIRLSQPSIQLLRKLREPPPTLADINAARQRFERASCGSLAAAIASEAARFGLGDINPDRLSWIDRMPIHGESADASYARDGAVLPADNLWARSSLPQSADPAAARPPSERDAVLLELDRALAGGTEVSQRAWGEADPLQRLDRRLDAAADLLGTARASLEDALRYNLHARWLLDYPPEVTPIQNGMGPLPYTPAALQALQPAADVLRGALRLWPA